LKDFQEVKLIIIKTSKQYIHAKMWAQTTRQRLTKLEHKHNLNSINMKMKVIISITFRHVSLRTEKTRKARIQDRTRVAPLFQGPKPPPRRRCHRHFVQETPTFYRQTCLLRRSALLWASPIQNRCHTSEILASFPSAQWRRHGFLTRSTSAHAPNSPHYAAP